MDVLIVVNNPKDWPLELPEVNVVSAKSYLNDESWNKARNVKVFNLTKSYRYQSIGYYVSLLGEARGHKPVPSVQTIQDMKSQTMVRFVSDELDELIQKSLKPLQSEEFTLSIYFGRNVAKRYDQLSRHLYNQFQAPLLRAHFVWNKKWILQNISPIAGSDIPEDHLKYVIDFARDYFGNRAPVIRKKQDTRFDLAILVNPDEDNPPSDERAIERFVKSAENHDFYVELIRREDYGRLAEFDALFIRETTAVNHHTYRFARRAAAEGLVVLDDPESILRCTNKVYLAELLQRHNMSTPDTVIVHSENRDQLGEMLEFPIILKQPDSSFSQGVIKIEDEAQLKPALDQMFNRSDLLIAQKFMPTKYDWRIGILDNKPLFVCRYYMARKHWQIYDRTEAGKTYAGKVDTLEVWETPREVLQTALKAANLIGSGLYGVDVKHIDGKAYVMEVNDNPSIESGIEDKASRQQLYDQIMDVILGRVEQKKGRNQP